MTGHLTIDELADASQQSHAACCALLRELGAAALLDVQMTVHSAGSLAVGDASAASQRGNRNSANDAATSAALNPSDHTVRSAGADDERGGLAQKLWRELGFVRAF